MTADVARTANTSTLFYFTGQCISAFRVLLGLPRMPEDPRVIDGRITLVIVNTPCSVHPGNVSVPTWLHPDVFSSVAAFKRQLCRDTNVAPTQQVSCDWWVSQMSTKSCTQNQNVVGTVKGFVIHKVLQKTGMTVSRSYTHTKQNKVVSPFMRSRSRYNAVAFCQ